MHIDINTKIHTDAQSQKNTNLCIIVVQHHLKHVWLFHQPQHLARQLVPNEQISRLGAHHIPRVFRDKGVRHNRDMLTVGQRLHQPSARRVPDPDATPRRRDDQRSSPFVDVRRRCADAVDALLLSTDRVDALQDVLNRPHLYRPVDGRRHELVHPVGHRRQGYHPTEVDVEDLNQSGILHAPDVEDLSDRGHQQLAVFGEDY